jgi:hypothetical protein
MASWPTEYDEVTCITAAELRWMGIAVPEDTPDVAWIPRAAQDKLLAVCRERLAPRWSGGRLLVLRSAKPLT